MITKTLLGIFVTPYGLVLSFSAVAGLALSVWLTKEDRLVVLHVGLGLIFSGLIGARIGFVLHNLSFYLDNPWDIFQLWLGGLTWFGALVGAALALVGVHLIWKLPLGELADGYLPLVGFLVLAIWLTGWGAGIGYGPEIDAWFGIPVRDVLGQASRRWPLPIIGGLVSSAWVVGAIFFPLRPAKEAGFRTILALAGLAGINLIISFFRVDPAPTLAGLRWESWFSGAIFLASIIYIYLNKENNQND